MYASLRWALHDLRSFFQLDEEQRRRYIVDADRHFTRRRQLTFERTAVLVLSLLKKAWPLSCLTSFAR